MALFPEILSEKAVLGLQALQGAKNENSNMGRIEDCILAERSKERAA